MELLSALAAAAVPVAILYAAWRKAPLSLTLAVAMLASFVLGSVAGGLGGVGGTVPFGEAPRGAGSVGGCAGEAPVGGLAFGFAAAPLVMQIPGRRKAERARDVSMLKPLVAGGGGRRGHTPPPHRARAAGAAGR